jgi:hypothetical protein
MRGWVLAFAELWRFANAEALLQATGKVCPGRGRTTDRADEGPEGRQEAYLAARETLILPEYGEEGRKEHKGCIVCGAGGAAKAVPTMQGPPLLLGGWRRLVHRASSNACATALVSLQTYAENSKVPRSSVSQTRSLACIEGGGCLKALFYLKRPSTRA